MSHNTCTVTQPVTAASSDGEPALLMQQATGRMQPAHSAALHPRCALPATWQAPFVSESQLLTPAGRGARTAQAAYHWQKAACTECSTAPALCAASPRQALSVLGRKQMTLLLWGSRRCSSNIPNLQLIVGCTDEVIAHLVQNRLNTVKPHSSGYGAVITHTTHSPSSDTCSNWTGACSAAAGQPLALWSAPAAALRRLVLLNTRNMATCESADSHSQAMRCDRTN
jgi:hypothetical protein